VTLGQMFLPMLQRIRRGESASTAFVEGQLARGRRRFGSYIVHSALIVAFIAIAVSSTMRQQTELHFTKGQTLQASGFDVTFLGADERTEPHRTSVVGRFAIARDGKQVATLEPRMNQYEGMREPIGTPDVHTTAGGDFYVALSNIDLLNQTTSVNVYAAPLVVWIWISVIVMGLGALFGLIPSRRRAVVLSAAKDPLPDGATESA
jgi:cytochrome c-type biogenesis protein CcmF